MRKIDELGISPTPWVVDDAINQTTMPDIMKCVRDKDTAVLWMPNCFINDASLIAAAPKLYEKLREAVIEMCHDCPSCAGIENGYECKAPAGRCFVQKWRAVLAKASGEDID